MPILDTSEVETTEQGDDRLLAEARARYQRGAERAAKWRTRADEAFAFVGGEQWPDAMRQEREAEGTPTLTINILRQHALLVANAIRQNRPGQVVGPVDDQGDVKTAEKIQGLLRHIEYESDAETAYDAAAWTVVVTGLGYLLVRARYETPGTFDQTLCIDAIPDPRAVVFDPSSVDPTGKDAEWAFLVRRLSWAALKARWPESKTVAAHDTSGSWLALGHGLPDWTTADECQVADYWCREWHTATLHRVPQTALAFPEVQAWMQDAMSVTTLADGQMADVLHETACPQMTDPDTGQTLDPCVQRRPVRVPVVMHYQMTAHEILEKEVWSGNPQADPDGWLPLVRVVGVPVQTVDGLLYDGLVLPASDGQRFTNYTASAVAESIGMSPKAPFIGYRGTMDRPEWATANTVRHARLEVEPFPEGWPREAGPAPLPQRSFGEPPIQAVSQALGMAQEFIKQVTGQFDPTRGQQTGDARSGKAIRLLQSQGQTSSFHFGDNLHKAIRQACRVLLVQIPQRFDAARVTRIIGEDGTARLVQLNAPTRENGQDALFDVTVGRYDLVAGVGKDYQTKRQEAQDGLPQLVQAMPLVGQVAPDLVLRSFDVPYVDQIADRAKRALAQQMPFVLGPEDHDALRQEKGAQQVPPQVQAQMQQMGQALQQAQRAAQDAEADRALKREELETRIHIAAMNALVQLATTDAKLGHAEMLPQLEATFQQAAELQGHDQTMRRENAGRLHDVMSQVIQHRMQAAAQPAMSPMQSGPPTGGAEEQTAEPGEEMDSGD